MPLYAESMSSDPLILVGGMVLTSLGAVVASVLQWLTARDKLKYDATLINLNKDKERLERDNAELRQENDELEQKREKDARELREEIREVREENRQLYERLGQLPPARKKPV